jgi:hypothetical protein
LIKELTFVEQSLHLSFQIKHLQLLFTAQFQNIGSVFLFRSSEMLNLLFALLQRLREDTRLLFNRFFVLLSETYRTFLQSSVEFSLQTFLES